MTRLCFVDTETTGLDPDRHEVYEIGLIVRNDDEKPDQEYRWWLPVDLTKADPTGLRIGRYFDRHPDCWNFGLSRIWYPDSSRDGVIEDGKGTHESFKDCAQSLMRFTAGAHLVGAVPSFDAAFLSRFLRVHGCCPAWHYHLVDVEALAAGYLAGKDPQADAPLNSVLAEEGVDLCRPPWHSTDLSRAIGVEPDDFERHTALGDARWVRAVYDAVVGK